MSETFKVEQTLAREEWTGNYGPMITYRLAVNGGLEVDLNQKPDTPAPQVGDEIWGHLVDGRDRKKIVKDRKEGGSWDGGGGSGSGGDDLGPVIHRQVALKIIAPKICETGRLTDGLKNLARELEAFIDDATNIDEALATPAATPPAGNGSASSASTDFDPAALTSLLELAGLNASAAGTVCTYVVTEMPVNEQDAAIDKLADATTRDKALARLVERTEKHTGEPLPEGSADTSDIPF